MKFIHIDICKKNRWKYVKRAIAILCFLKSHQINAKIGKKDSGLSLLSLSI